MSQFLKPRFYFDVIHEEIIYFLVKFQETNAANVLKSIFRGCLVSWKVKKP